MRKELPKFFEQVLNITEPWYIEKIEQQGNTINIYVDFKKSAKFEYNGKYYSAYETVQRICRYLSKLEQGNISQKQRQYLINSMYLMF